MLWPRNLCAGFIANEDLTVGLRSLCPAPATCEDGLRFVGVLCLGLRNRALLHSTVIRPVNTLSSIFIVTRTKLES